MTFITDPKVDFTCITDPKLLTHIDTNVLIRYILENIHVCILTKKRCNTLGSFPIRIQHVLTNSENQKNSDSYLILTQYQSVILNIKLRYLMKQCTKSGIKNHFRSSKCDINPPLRKLQGRAYKFSNGEICQNRHFQMLRYTKR